MDFERKVLNLNISKKYSDLLNELSKGNSEDKNYIVEEALRDYFEKKDILEEENIEETEKAIFEEDENQLNKINETNETNENSLINTNVLLMLPVYKSMWDFTEIGDLIIGKRKVKEIFEFKGFLGFSDNDIKEYKVIVDKFKILKKEGNLLNISKSQKDYIEVNIDEIKSVINKYKDFSFTPVKGNDGVYGFVKTNELKNILFNETHYKDNNARFYVGKFIIICQNEAQMFEICNMYNLLLKKLNIIGEKIYEGYKPIDIRWNNIKDEKERGLRFLHSTVQIIVGALLFIGITIAYISRPQLFYIPLPDEVVAQWRYFLGAYVLSLPVFLVIINYIIIYAVWFKSRISLIQKSVREIVDKDIKALKEKIGVEIFR